TVTQRFATSDDGTRVPYFEIAPARAEAGPAPTLLYGYGGFEIPLLPAYSGVVGRAWLERGGVLVIANVRGGGEYGPRWHQAALLDRRPPGGQHAGALPGAVRGRGVPGAAPRHAALLEAPGRSLVDGRVRRPRRPGRLGVRPHLLALPPARGRAQLPAGDVHHLHARRPRAPRPRAQDGGAHAGGRRRRHLLREHRGRPRRRRDQRAGGVHAGAGLRVPVATPGRLRQPGPRLLQRRRESEAGPLSW